MGLFFRIAIQPKHPAYSVAIAFITILSASPTTYLIELRSDGAGLRLINAPSQISDCGRDYCL